MAVLGEVEKQALFQCCFICEFWGSISVQRKLSIPTGRTRTKDCITEKKNRAIRVTLLQKKISIYEGDSLTSEILH